MSLTSIDYAISQIGYPLAGDIDDCWAVATIWAARRSLGPTMYMPTMTEFRRAAGNPDDPHASDGGTTDQIKVACTQLWPQLAVQYYRSQDRAGFELLLKRGWTASLALLSSHLPLSMRHNFRGGHQVGVFHDGVGLRMMNPLQKDGATPYKISADNLISAARAWGLGYILAAMFPPASEVTSMAFRFDFSRRKVAKGKPFYESPGGAKIGSFANDTTITIMGIPLDRSTDGSPGRNYAWRAALVHTGAMDKSVGPKVVYVRFGDLGSEVTTPAVWDSEIRKLLLTPSGVVADATSAVASEKLAKAKSLAGEIVKL